MQIVWHAQGPCAAETQGRSAPASEADVPARWAARKTSSREGLITGCSPRRHTEHTWQARLRAAARGSTRRRPHRGDRGEGHASFRREDGRLREVFACGGGAPRGTARVSPHPGTARQWCAAVRARRRAAVRRGGVEVLARACSGRQRARGEAAPEGVSSFLTLRPVSSHDVQPETSSAIFCAHRPRTPQRARGRAATGFTHDAKACARTARIAHRANRARRALPHIPAASCRGNRIARCARTVHAGLDAHSPQDAPTRELRVTLNEAGGEEDCPSLGLSFFAGTNRFSARTGLGSFRERARRAGQVGGGQRPP